jgi:polyisoprenoid-binding protein YceI
MAPTTWKTDLTHTDISFSTKHMMVTTVRGTFTEVEGTMTLDEANPGASGGSFTVKAASVSTGAEGRDQHLRSNDFFHSESYPNITFISSKVEPVNERDYRVTGYLTIRDVTKPVTFDVEFLGFYQGFTGRRAGFQATAKVNREDFGLTWNMPLQTGGWLVGKDIKLEIDLAMDEVVAEGIAAEPALATA